VTGSFVMLASMIRNLLDNVLRFTPQGDVSTSESTSRQSKQSCRLRMPSLASPRTI
jgi:hypothetical protein